VIKMLAAYYLTTKKPAQQQPKSTNHAEQQPKATTNPEQSSGSSELVVPCPTPSQQQPTKSTKTSCSDLIEINSHEEPITTGSLKRSASSYPLGESIFSKKTRLHTSDDDASNEDHGEG